MTTATTIKVPRDLRDRINADARAAGSTVAAFLEALLDDRERAQRMAAVGAALATGVDAEYEADLAAWDAIAAGNGG